MRFYYIEGSSIGFPMLIILPERHRQAGSFDVFSHNRSVACATVVFLVV